MERDDHEDGIGAGLAHREHDEHAAEESLEAAPLDLSDGEALQRYER
jgi:hypothetical protein